MRDEDNRSRSYGYDTNGGMTSATDLGGANGWQYTYALNRSAQIIWDESGTVGLAPIDARATAYEFGPQDNSRATSPSAATSDSHFTSELRTVRTPLGDVTTFDRDSAGRPSSVTLPWGAQKSYAYADNDANPETVTLPQRAPMTRKRGDSPLGIQPMESCPCQRQESPTRWPGTTPISSVIQRVDTLAPPSPSCQP